MGVRLECPFCRSVVIDGRDPAPGTCGGCGAAYAGDEPTAQAAVSRALADWGATDDPAALLDQLFTTDPNDPGTADAIASDEREGFYNWWVFRRRAPA